MESCGAIISRRRCGVSLEDMAGGERPNCDTSHKSRDSSRAKGHQQRYGDGHYKSFIPSRAKQHLCSTVQAADKQGKVYGVSQPAIFSIQSADITITNFTVSCGGAFGTYSYSLTVTNYGSNPFSITSLAFTGASVSSVTYSPTPAGTIVNPGTGNAVTFTGVFTYNGTFAATIYATVSGNQVGNSNLTSTDTDVTSFDACVCDVCDRLPWQAGSATQTLSGNTFNIVQPFNPTGLGSIVAVKAEVISFSRYVDDNCMTCDKDSSDWGNFTAGTFANLPRLPGRCRSSC